MNRTINTCIFNYLFVENADLSGGEIFNANKRNLVSGLNLIVIGGVGKSQGQHALFLQVSFYIKKYVFMRNATLATGKVNIYNLNEHTVNTSETLDNDGSAAKVSRFEGSVLSTTAFAVVLITDSNPFDALGLVVASGIGHSSPFASQLILDLVSFTVLGVNGTALPEK